MTTETLTKPEIHEIELSPELIEILAVPKTPRQYTLDWLRGMGYQGDELPKGKQFKTTHCVVALALTEAMGYSMKCSGLTYGSGLIGHSENYLPSQVAAFVLEFDSGKHPDLEL